MTVGPGREAPVYLFLSHATADSAVVGWLEAQVKAMGIVPYLAEHDPQPGRDLGDKVIEAITHCDAMLVVLTSAGYASSFVQQEIGAARHANKPIFALVERDILDRDRGMLAGAEVIIISGDDLAGSSAALVATLRRISAEHGLAPPPLEVSTQPALQLTLGVELQLTSNQVLFGLLLLTACAGLVYLASRDVGGFGSPPA
jgi:hypothetical protein